MRAIGCGVLATLVGVAGAQTGWQPAAPGATEYVLGKEAQVLQNRAIEARFSTRDGLRILDIRNRWTGDSPFPVSEAFRLVFRDSRSVPASSMEMVGPMVRLRGKGIEGLQATLRDRASGLTATWRAFLPYGAHYLREDVTLKADADADIAEVYLGEGPGRGPMDVVGKVPGSPIVSGNYFAGLEHPMSESRTDRSGWSVRMLRKLPLRKGQSIVYSSVVGVAPAGQMRRAFLSYVEGQRPRKYEPFLHYNSWYDLGYFTKYTADECVERIRTFGDQLARQRKVHLRSFLFDDGWDDTSTVWEFHSGFPRGFAPLKEAAEAFGADPGIWLSPWGGYSTPRQQRLATGRAQGYEIDSQGYALSGPKYYQRFHDVCMGLVRDYGINQFKFDGTGSPDKQYPGSQFASDFEAAIALIHDLREANPRLFVNLTTGTWPSPFWTRYADSIWRGGSDHSFAGVGPWREQWITYRDGDTYHGVVQRGPLYPINSLMLHGLIYAQHARNLSTDPTSDFRNEVRSYFATGTQLQEMYLTPSLLTKQNWDDLAEAANWSWSNREVLADSHWVGGDPNNLEVYGWASWTPKKAILTLRNPSDKPQAFSIEPRRVFELPPAVKGRFLGYDPYARERRQTPLNVPADGAKVVLLQPFEVRVIEGVVR